MPASSERGVPLEDDPCLQQEYSIPPYCHLACRTGNAATSYYFTFWIWIRFTLDLEELDRGGLGRVGHLRPLLTAWARGAWGAGGGVGQLRSLGQLRLLLTA